MSAKGLTYWENVWNQANTQFETAHPLNRDESTPEQRARHKNLFIIDAMLKNYSSLYFTTYGKKLAEYYSWDAPLEPEYVTLTRLRSSFVKVNSNTYNYTHGGHGALSFAAHIEVHDHISSSTQQHYFVSCDHDDDIDALQEQFNHTLNKKDDSTLHIYMVAFGENKNIPKTATKHPEYQRLKNEEDYASIQIAMRNMRQKAMKSDAIYENGDLHQILQVIEKKTNVSIQDMGFKIKKPEPSFLSYLLNCLFPPVARQKEEKAPLITARKKHEI